LQHKIDGLMGGGAILPFRARVTQLLRVLIEILRLRLTSLMDWF